MLVGTVSLSVVLCLASETPQRSGTSWSSELHCLPWARTGEVTFGAQRTHALLAGGPQLLVALNIYGCAAECSLLTSATSHTLRCPPSRDAQNGQRQLLAGVKFILSSLHFLKHIYWGVHFLESEEKNRAPCLAQQGSEALFHS